jgi:FKBP-type peptidyl-prolyl cis-trans isomerase
MKNNSHKKSVKSEEQVKLFQLLKSIIIGLVLTAIAIVGITFVLEQIQNKKLPERTFETVTPLPTETVKKDAEAEKTAKESAKKLAQTNATKLIEEVRPKLNVETIVVGVGTEVTAGSTAVVHYTGTLTDGTQFDSSTGKAPFAVQNVGAARVITGWNAALLGMKVGGKYKITVPPEFAYANEVNGQIPANSTLIFEMEVVSVTE